MRTEIKELKDNLGGLVPNPPKVLQAIGFILIAILEELRYLADTEAQKS
jgi:hypothetical protein